MYLFIFSVMLLFSALNLKAQQAAECEMAAEGDGGVACAQTLFLGPSDSAEDDDRDLDNPRLSGFATRALLDDRESEFFDSLKNVAARLGCTVMAKVNLQDVVTGQDLRGSTRAQFKRANKGLDRQHVDFVVCSGNSLEIRLVVRLHPLPGMRPLHRLQQRRIDSAVSAFGIPVLLYPPAEVYDEQDLLATVMEQLPDE